MCHLLVNVNKFSGVNHVFALAVLPSVLIALVSLHNREERKRSSYYLITTVQVFYPKMVFFSFPKKNKNKKKNGKNLTSMNI